ncbi:PREDICTED: putative phosphatidylglycerol/phosphatidylinositol transfer protein DDB_G0278295 [Amphimedon queenslandica]|uniref:MD-2-related lipid-recognition domain-containing protein n=1 Tax=Amphimedon queenslandica TaxID=400682 RepID=A0A1X7UMR1_AMPQE|nr:PREDICTED: putative phosphatidylglycerol/phosphatidylinositol transfer protein DDB_G0278295 [Amphimedon queenslandica]|eukprot:XP_003387342.1 PREDICTED: putative phosphatidylglycerol/phosphatidylinositol transfer protein DDB_G0278295 [Amphimedon queenslandica]
MKGFLLYFAVSLAIATTITGRSLIKIVDFQPPVNGPEKLRDESPVKNCTKPGGPMKVTKILVSPTTLKAGQPINVQASYTLDMLIQDGDLKIDINLAGDQESLDLGLCDAFTIVGIKCPLVQTQSGFFNVTQTIPAEAPVGHYTANITASTKTGVEFLCVTLDFMMEG